MIELLIGEPRLSQRRKNLRFVAGHYPPSNLGFNHGGTEHTELRWKIMFTFMDSFLLFDVLRVLRASVVKRLFEDADGICCALVIVPECRVR
jgi:hypothetical protein